MCLGLILFNDLLWKFRPLAPDENDGAPTDVVRFMRAGARPFFSLEPFESVFNKENSWLGAPKFDAG